jgi:hypothetical protein
VESGEQPRLELVRAWENYFRQKGGRGPAIAPDVIGVLPLDDAAAYPPYRRWHTGGAQAAVAAQFSYVGIWNNDTPEKKSVLVVDELLARPITAADDLVVGVSLVGQVAGFSDNLVEDTAEEKDQQPSHRPFIGNVHWGTCGSATNAASATWPHNALTGATLKGPWSLGPQGLLLLRTGVVNNGLSFYARGRYYEAL